MTARTRSKALALAFFTVACNSATFSVLPVSR
jgi:hypothetical protein